MTIVMLYLFLLRSLFSDDIHLLPRTILNTAFYYLGLAPKEGGNR